MPMSEPPPPPPPMSGSGFTALAGMSKSDLYEVMYTMKLLMDQNEQQAKQVLVDNPALTKALFHAQIMLGMVKAPEAKTSSQPSSTNIKQQANVPGTPSLPIQAGKAGQASSSQVPVPAKKQQQNQSSISPPSTSLPPATYQSQIMPTNPSHPGQQTKGYMNSQIPSLLTAQSSQMHTSSQIHNVPLPPSSVQQYSISQSHIHMTFSQAQESLQNPGVLPQPLQPPFPQQPNPSSLQTSSHHLHSQAPYNLGLQQSSLPQTFSSQPIFHSGGTPPPSFSHGQPPLPSQPPPQQLYQGGSHIGSDYGSQSGSSMQAERGAPWAPSLPEKPAAGLQLPRPPTLFPGQVPADPTGQPPHPAPLTPEMEQALVHQVMSLTPEQISLLPPEQQSQVIKLQEMFR